ncbi:MAG TPA: aquaporin [Puia sp.]|uniref:MIP/aquaporin family protein n=1 Tax=Puia sp. TaxID=2045100 RepID=UPI002CE4D7CD|nr:aquaporin [Puia sp.]HVU94430.1 aquaporin [Puia sp.]
MRAMNIRVATTRQGWPAAKLALQKNIRFYGMEALGLAIFMVSACFFAVLLESPASPVHAAIPNANTRLCLTGILMGLTALLIFYSPWTAPSGSHINPAVTLTFLRLGRIGPWDALFYILFQTLGGLVAVCLMALALGPGLTKSPVSYAVTVPGKGGVWMALLAELIIGFIMMTIVLHTSGNKRGGRYTRPIAACLVCANVIVAGPISGFGMNPARSLASALPAGIFTGWWIYLFAPVLSMLAAAEWYKHLKRTK